ncbi:MAG TPA: selenocysteine-specific translation elongation factor [Actinomycetota bacterium]|nr:selenocysteine-specific translation elongation factor [Actinomycetota bacterium]
MHVIGTAGHVDHGKSTLVKALTGMDPDRFEEEKRRGLTIDLGFAWATLPSGREIGLVDVPGHERFIKNMLAGVGGVDAALFVVAADEGWMPQSAEHLQILDFLQVSSAIVVLTKSDLVDTERLQQVRTEVTERLAGTSLEGAPAISVSSSTGEGIDALSAALDDLLSGVEETADRGRPRLFVDRSFTITGSGTVVTGTLTGGTMSVGDEVEILPAGHRARIRALQTHRHPVDTAVPGSRVAVNLVGVEKQRVMRGDALVPPGTWKQTDNFAARLRTSRDRGHALTEKGAYELYVGSAELPCRVRFLEELPEGEGGLGPGASLLVQVFTMRPVPVEPMDRFVVRDVGRWQTVAGGVVLDHAPGRLRRGDRDVIDRLNAREAEVRDDLVARIAAERGIVTVEDLRWLSGAGDDRLQRALERAAAAGQVVRLPGYVVDRSRAETLLTRAKQTVAAHHEAHRLEPGIAREALRRALDLDAKPLAAFLELWSSAGELEVEGVHVRLPGHSTGLDPADRAEADRVLAQLRAGGVSPPEVEAPRELLRAMARAGEIVEVTPGIVYAADVMSEIEKKVVALIAVGGPATVSQVRDAVGTTRKYAVPLLEHLDATGVTQRNGDARVLGPRGRTLQSS